MKPLLFAVILLSLSGCASVFGTKKIDPFCARWPDRPPVLYFDGDGEKETRQKDELVIYWVTRCER